MNEFDLPFIHKYTIVMKKRKEVYPFEVNAWAIPAPVSRRGALIADLHGQDPAPVLTALRAAAPELIFVAGDLLECRKSRGRAHAAEKNENAYAFLMGAAALAPTFYAPGNHEAALGDAERRRIGQTGAILLENRAVASQGFLIGGITSRPDREFLERFSRMIGYKILLCHHPEYYESLLRPLDIQLILAGHAHGGQFRAWGRGIYAPGQGILPPYTGGFYQGRLLVSRGLANNLCLPRINNKKELLILHFGPDQGKAASFQ